MLFSVVSSRLAKLAGAICLASALAACAPTAPVEYAPPQNAPADEVAPRFRRQVVADTSGRAPGTIVVDPGQRYLYLIEPGGKAMRYGVGVGKAGAAWSGSANVAYKREWPNWTPTKAMIAREPDKYRKWAGGMAGGPENPLGARALYLYNNGKDTHYRIHGTNEPWSIGTAVSSGCIRMMNEDVEDLYSRVGVGARVIVLPTSRRAAPPANDPQALDDNADDGGDTEAPAPDDGF